MYFTIHRLNLSSFLLELESFYIGWEVRWWCESDWSYGWWRLVASSTKGYLRQK